jgi:hypothetical protein
MITVVTGRFDNNTLEANYAYRNKKNFACIYSCPSQLSPKISLYSPVFVIEMNNSTNKICGIGLIKNKSQTQKYYKVHLDGNTNRYTYIGKHFIDREIIYRRNESLVDILEHILFKGKTHSKRGSGLSLIPEKILKFDICQGRDIKIEIKELFISYFKELNS